MQKIRRQIKQFLPRRFQVYGVGCAKTGSTSLASMFSLSYRTSHEPRPKQTNRLIIDWLEKRIDKNELQKQLIERDRDLKLELESAHPLVRIAHSKRSENKIEALEKIAPEFVKEKIWFHCQKIITKYFPETLADYQ